MKKRLNQLAIIIIALYIAQGVIKPMFGSKTWIVHNETPIAQADEVLLPNPCELQEVVCEGEGSVGHRDAKGIDDDGRTPIVALIRETFGDEAETAIAIAKAESGLNPKAVNEKNSNGSSDYGLFQINSIHNPTEEQKFNAEENIKMSKRIYDARGNWTAWSAYNNGSFKKYL